MRFLFYWVAWRPPLLEGADRKRNVREKFRRVSQEVQTELADENGVAKWKALFKRQKKYRTLRGMVFAMLYEQAQSASE